MYAHSLSETVYMSITLPYRPTVAAKVCNHIYRGRQKYRTGICRTMAVVLAMLSHLPTEINSMEMSRVDLNCGLCISLKMLSGLRTSNFQLMCSVSDIKLVLYIEIPHFVLNFEPFYVYCRFISR